VFDTLHSPYCLWTILCDGGQAPVKVASSPLDMRPRLLLKEPGPHHKTLFPTRTSTTYCFKYVDTSDIFPFVNNYFMQRLGSFLDFASAWEYDITDLGTVVLRRGRLEALTKLAL